MGNVSINLRLRPIRFAFLVRPDDRKHILETFRINTCLWGGKYNPIVPFFKQVPKWWERNGRRFESAKQILNGYLDFFEPDFLVEAEKGMASGLGFDTERILRLSDLLIQEGDRTEHGFGLSVNDLYLDLYRKEFQFARRHKHNIVHVEPEGSAFSAFAACNFGGFPTQRPLRYFEKNYIDAFDPQRIVLTSDSLAKLYRRRYTSALRIGESKLDVRYNDWSDPDLFVLDASKSRDLIDFWNERATRRNIMAIPVQWIQDLSAFCRDFLMRNYRPLPGNPHGVMIRPKVIFSRSIPEGEVDGIYDQYMRVDKKDANAYVKRWYPSFWRSAPEFVARTTRPILAGAKNRIDVPVDVENPVITFNTLWPDFAEEHGNRHRIANVVKLSGWGYGDQIATVFPWNYRNPLLPKIRVSLGRVLPTTEGLVLFPEYKDISERWDLTQGTEALSTWFKENKIAGVLSDGGRATHQIIQRLEGFWGVGKIACAGIVKLLDEMSRKPLAKSMHYAEFRQKIKDGVGKDTWRGKEFETLVERQAVELGLELRCAKCRSWSWHALKQLDYSVICGLCLQPFTFPITKPRSNEDLRWAYRVVGPFALPHYANGGYAAALAIRFFSDVIGRMDKVDVTWSAGQDLTLPSGRKVESDFILWYQRKKLLSLDYPTEIVFGEAKSFGKDVFKEADIQDAKALAEAFPGAVLVFAAMKEGNEFSEEEIVRIRKLAEWGREYNKEGSGTRAPVIVLTGTELFISFSLEQSWKERGGRHAQLISPAWMSTRTNNLRLLADLTQRLYLNMPSYSTWLEEKWKHRRAVRERAAKRSPV